MHHGMYIPLMRSFLNFSASRCYKIYKLLWSDAKAGFWNMLHRGYADSLGWYRHEANDFENSDVHEFVVNIGLYTYEQYIKREKKGIRTKHERFSMSLLNKKVKSAIKSENIKNKLSGFFAKFSKKKKDK